MQTNSSGFDDFLSKPVREADLFRVLAIILDSSIHTVKKHANNLFAKLGVETRTAAARTALNVLNPQA